MKKFLLVLLALLFASNVSAYPMTSWDMDLTTLGAGSDSDIAALEFSGVSFLNQSYNGNGQLDDGDTFTEGSLFYSLTGFNLNRIPAPTSWTLDLNGGDLYMEGINLEGYVRDVTGNDWNYVFTSADSLKLYFDLDGIGVGNAAVELLDFALMTPSGGEINNFPNGNSSGIVGNSTLTSNLSVSTNDIFTDNIFGGLFEDFLSNPSNSIFANVVTTNRVLTDLEFTTEGFTTSIYSDGNMVFSAVPEPTTFLLLGGGLMGLGFYARRRK